MVPNQTKKIHTIVRTERLKWTGHVEREIKMSESKSADISVLVVWEVNEEVEVWRYGTNMLDKT